MHTIENESQSELNTAQKKIESFLKNFVTQLDKNDLRYNLVNQVIDWTVSNLRDISILEAMYLNDKKLDFLSGFDSYSFANTVLTPLVARCLSRVNYDEQKNIAEKLANLDMLDINKEFQSLTNLKNEHASANPTLNNYLVEFNYYQINHVNREYANIKAKYNELDNKIESKQKRIDEQKSELNFIELNQAFQKLTKELIWEKRRSFSILAVLAAALICVPYWTYSQHVATIDFAKMSFP